MNMFSTPFRAIVLVSAIWVAIGWLVGFLRPLDAALGLRLPAWVRFPGVGLIVCGAALMLICGAMLSKCGIGTLHGDEWSMPKEFLAVGPFRFVRNPMSLGGTLLMAGIALWHRSTLGAGLAALVFLVFHLVVVWMEEPGLEKRFGDTYREYQRHVPRWIPRLRPWRP